MCGLPLQRASPAYPSRTRPTTNPSRRFTDWMKRSSACARHARDRRNRRDVMLIGRAECFLVGHEDALNESIRRFASLCGSRRRLPLCTWRAQTRGHRSTGQGGRAETVQSSRRSRLAADARRYRRMGVRRISVGGALAGAAWGALRVPPGISPRDNSTASRKMRQNGSCKKPLPNRQG